ncbi:Transcription factor iws1 [Serendipita sp. 411]|nr:Transcription factor iws1 [Serendipita sp. 400]KAG8854651.1 Transcription factor iws1 [Serendipita sp. 411]
MAHDPRSTKQIALERDIFGQGSDLSSDEDKQRTAPRKEKNKVPRPRQDPPESSDSGGEDYVREKAKKTNKRKPRATAGDEETPKRKRKKATSPNPDVPLTAEEMRKMKLDQSIKEVLKPSKRVKRRTKQNEDDLDKIADDYVANLRVDMMRAANDDKDAHREGVPAISKLRMLDRVMDTLQKRQYATAIMDQDLLGACKIWLEPLDNKSLPALNIQKAFFDHFLKMNIDTETLRESGLGRIVLFYTKCKRVIEPIQRIASQLVDIWTRPILKRSSSYFDKVVPTASQEDMEGLRVQMPKLSAILSQARLAEKGRTRKNAVAVPERNLTEYTVAPRVSSSILMRNPHDDTLAMRRNNKEMLKRLQKKTDRSGKV